MATTVRRLDPPPRRPTLAELENDPYPHSDGVPMGESQPHLQAIRWILDALEDLLPNRPDLSIHGDMFWYWEEGNPSAVRAPDTMVIFGVPMDPFRLSFKSWAHGGKVPTVIIETASEARKELSFTEIFEDYQRLRVSEYFVFDWSGKYHDEPLYGFRLRGSRYQPIRPAKDGGLTSQKLGAVLYPEGQMLRFVTTDGRRIATRLEQIEAVRAQIQTRADAVAQLDAELARERAKSREQAEALKQALARLKELGHDPDAGKGG